jgi:hypothetical protein
VIKELLGIEDGVAVEVSDPITMDSAGGASKLEVLCSVSLKIKVICAFD